MILFPAEPFASPQVDSASADEASHAPAIDSRFFTMDVALRTDGEWRVIELGDGQVAGLPPRIDRGLLSSAFPDRLTFLR